ncbi:MAG: hypothetical protein V3V08_19290 [Nannocystaceae bacterium]
MDTSFPSHRWHGRWLHLHNRNLVVRVENKTLHGDARERLNPSVVSKCGQVLEDPVRDFQSTRRSIVADANEQIPWLMVVGKVVGEGADCSRRFVGLPGRFGALHTVAFQVSQQET